MLHIKMLGYTQRRVGRMVTTGKIYFYLNFIGIIKKPVTMRNWTLNLVEQDVHLITKSVPLCIGQFFFYNKKIIRSFKKSYGINIKMLI